MTDTTQIRARFAQAQRVVVKIGSRVLVQSRGRPDRRRMAALVSELATHHRQGCSLALVSSGAVGAGMEALGLATRPSAIPDLQMAAAVGQSRLMALYDEFFSTEGCCIGQMLVTHDDLKHRQRHLNARHTLMNLLRHRIIPIINENDAVAVDEIKFGDNDMLAALIALLIPADLLILLTTVDGVREPTTANRTRRIPHIERLTKELMTMTAGAGSTLSTGGMASKLHSAQKAATMNIPVVIANGRSSSVITRILAGEDVGTLCYHPPGKAASLSGRKRWIAFFHKPQGALWLDDGACRALNKSGKSLLPIGIVEVRGDFASGALVEICDARGHRIGQGLVDYAAVDIEQIKGHRTTAIEKILGHRDYDEVIHRDNLVLDP